MRLWALGQLVYPSSEDHDQPDEDPDDEADQAAAAFGLSIDGERPADAIGGDVYLWPECLGSWAVWLALQTQWNLGPSGHRAGLDHAAVLADLRAMGFGPGKRRSLRRMHAEVLAMEGAALAAWTEQIEREHALKGR